jgi:hypothetical protein
MSACCPSARAPSLYSGPGRVSNNNLGVDREDQDLQNASEHRVERAWIMICPRFLNQNMGRPILHPVLN